MARHRREPAKRRNLARLLPPAAAVVALTAGAALVVGIDDEADPVPDRTVVTAADSTAAAAPEAATSTADSSDRPPTDTPVDVRERPDRSATSGPPPTGEAAGFLGAVDLPELPGLRADWVGTRPVVARDNPAATLCDNARFSVPGVRQEQARTYVVPHQERLPRAFGLSETLGRFPTPPAAARFVKRIGERVGSCEDRVSSASVNAAKPVRSPDLSEGTRWHLRFDVGSRTHRYRLGVVRLGDRVAQVSFSPTDRHDVGARAFDRLLVRAGQRLRELDSD